MVASYLKKRSKKCFVCQFEEKSQMFVQLSEADINRNPFKAADSYPDLTDPSIKVS